MLCDDPIIAKYPQYLPTEEEVDLSLKLLQEPENKELLKSLQETVAIAGCCRSTMRRFCWQMREEKKYGPDCAKGAVEWLRCCKQSRERLQMDSLLQASPFSDEFRDLYAAAVPFSFHGIDKLGHPIYIARYGSVDIDAFQALWNAGEDLKKSAGLAVNGAVLYHLRNMEYLTRIVMAEETKRQGRVVDRMLMIMDVGGVSRRHWNSSLKEFLKGIAKESKPLFAETLHASVVVNVPAVISNMLWPLVKNVMKAVTQEKFTFLCSAEQLVERLPHLLDPESVPPYLGGTCTCFNDRGGSLWTWEKHMKEANRARAEPFEAEAEPLEVAIGVELASTIAESGSTDSEKVIVTPRTRIDNSGIFDLETSPIRAEPEEEPAHRRVCSDFQAEGNDSAPGVQYVTTSAVEVGCVNVDVDSLKLYDLKAAIVAQGGSTIEKPLSGNGSLAAASRALEQTSRAIATDKQVQALALSMSTGLVTLGAVGGTCGMAVGGAAGAAAGVLPAMFTLGLSIPAGAAVGGTVGTIGGIVIGSGAGIAAGGLTYKYRIEIKEGFLYVQTNASNAVAHIKLKLQTEGRSSTCLESLRNAAKSPKAKVTTASALGGGIIAGTGVGAVGLVSGSLVGGALGLIPALFTFGLSIPLGAAAGGGAGLCLGVAAGGSTGFVGGGVAGYAIQSMRH